MKHKTNGPRRVCLTEMTCKMEEAPVPQGARSGLTPTVSSHCEDIFATGGRQKPTEGVGRVSEAPSPPPSILQMAKPGAAACKNWIPPLLRHPPQPLRRHPPLHLALGGPQPACTALALSSVEGTGQSRCFNAPLPACKLQLREQRAPARVTAATGPAWRPYPSASGETYVCLP